MELLKVLANGDNEEKKKLIYTIKWNVLILYVSAL